MKRAYLFLFISFLTSAFNMFSQVNEKERGLKAINQEMVQAQMEFLASDWTEGRGTASKGIYLAADYIASLFKMYGIKPAGDYAWKIPGREERRRGVQQTRYRSYFQEIPFIETTPGDIQVLNIISNEGGVKSSLSLGYEADYEISGTQTGQEFEAPVVFVGYGFQDLPNGYDDFKGIDVKGKIIFRLSGYPGHQDTNSVAYKKFTPKERNAFFRIYRMKNEIAQNLGAIAVIDYNPGSDPAAAWATNVPFRFNTPYYEGDVKQPVMYDTRLSLQGKEFRNSLTAITLTKRAVNHLLKGSGIDLEKFETQAKDLLKPQSKILAGKSVFVKTTLNSRIVKCRNVLGMIEGENPNEMIVLGAHYDHLGKYNGVVWNGADDNASGTVGIMSIARAFAESGIKPQKTIVFALWTGEERGLLGSFYFVEKQLAEKEKMVLNLNYDMISRDDDSDTLGVQCRMSYLEGYDQLVEISKKNNQDFNIGLQVRYTKAAPGGGGGSDHVPFSRQNIPFMYFMAGFPKEYHQPVDHIELINWKKMTNIIRLGYLNIFDIATSKNPVGK
jgi:hypothetical protein